MTVKELINELLDCDMYEEVCLSDDTPIKWEHGTSKGSIYHITKVDKRRAEIKFDNYNHYVLKGAKE